MRNMQRPVISPFRTAIYSDAGFVLLGQVLARLSGTSYVDGLNNVVLEPLGLHDTSTAAPSGPDANVINRSTQANSSWGFDLPLYEA